jgi:hypothetical protein
MGITSFFSHIKVRRCPCEQRRTSFRHLPHSPWLCGTVTVAVAIVLLPQTSVAW